MKSNDSDRKEISHNYFSISQAQDALKAINTELDFHIENGVKNRRIAKLSRMVNAYET